MNIWIVNHHALTPDMSGGTRHYDLAKELVKKGHKVTIIASSFHYAKLEEMRSYGDSLYIRERLDEVDFIWLKTPPYRGSGLGRIRNMITFMRRTETIIPTLGLAKPDIIVGSSVHLFAVYAAYKLSRLYRVPFVMEVRDLWPQTLIDMGISKWHPFILLLAKLEKFLYKKAKKIITLLPGAYTYITGLGIDAGTNVWISNGVDMKPYGRKIRQRDDGLFHITYAGTIGKANVLDTLFEAAMILSPSHPEIRFHIVGSGELTEKYRAFIEKNGLKNIEISPAVPKSEIPELLQSSDLLYIGVMDSPLYRYGISMNKIFDYLASSTPVIIASNAFNNPIEEAGAGMTIPPEDTEALVKAILHYNSMDKEERIASVRHVRDYTCRHYSIEALADKFEHTLEGLL